MITIQQDGDRDLYAPVVVCDHCHRRIEDAADGNFEYVWDFDARRPVAIVQLHKQCSTPFRAGWALAAHGQLWMWEELPRWLEQLAGNLGMAQDASAIVLALTGPDMRRGG